MKNPFAVAEKPAPEQTNKSANPFNTKFLFAPVPHKPEVTASPTTSLPASKEKAPGQA